MVLVTKHHSNTGNLFSTKKFKNKLQRENYQKRDINSKIVTKKMDRFVVILQLGLDSRSRPAAESCHTHAAIAVEENTSESESTEIVKFLLLDFAS